MQKPEIILTYPLTAQMEKELGQRFVVHRWFEIGDHNRFLASNAAKIRAVVTGGHLGVAPELADALPNLEIVAINGVGFDKVDLDQARRRGFRVSHSPNVLTDDVADLAVGLTIALARQLPAGDRYIRNGCWSQGEMPLGRKISGQRVGILGMGRIGRATARRFAAFDCTIAYTDQQRLDVPYDFHATPTGLASDCRILVVAAAATPQTFHIVNAAVLEALGPKGMLVNVARGSLVDQAALIEALTKQRIAGAALDVFEAEPNVPSEFLGMSNVVVTPHIAAATHETRHVMGQLVLANLDAHFAGAPLPTPVV
jgi:lactate dehydrogenase-like 2-hydroxyacid dehydrogenase